MGWHDGLCYRDGKRLQELRIVNKNDAPVCGETEGITRPTERSVNRVSQRALRVKITFGSDKG